MQIRKIALLLILLFSLTVNVFAVGPLEEEFGTICVTMEHNGAPVSGGTLTAYRVAKIEWQEDAYQFVFTNQFADCGFSLDNLNSPELAAQYAQFAIEKNLYGMTRAITSQGYTRFEDLQVGLYLIVQHKAANGYLEASPFFITLPIEQGDSWVYEVDASPKISLREEPTTPAVPQKPPANIPQTGQLKWPIPVLCVAGLALFILGWALCFGKKTSKYET